MLAAVQLTDGQRGLLVALVTANRCEQTRDGTKPARWFTELPLGRRERDGWSVVLLSH